MSELYSLIQWNLSIVATWVVVMNGVALLICTKGGPSDVYLLERVSLLLGWPLQLQWNLTYASLLERVSLLLG